MLESETAQSHGGDKGEKERSDAEVENGDNRAHSLQGKQEGGCGKRG